MTLCAEAADVAVLVRSAMGERHDVVRYGRLSDNPDGGTITAERFGAETAKSLGYPATSTKPLSHPPPLKRTTPKACGLRAQFSILYFGRSTASGKSGQYKIPH